MKSIRIIKLANPTLEGFFYENFNLHFGVPQSDCCCTREELKVKLKSPHLNEAARRTASAELVVHKRKKPHSFIVVRKRKMKAKTSHTSSLYNLTLCRMFNFQEYLSRKLSIYVRFTTSVFLCTCSFIYIMKTEEEEAKTGPNEVCSLVYDYLMDAPPPHNTPSCMCIQIIVGGKMRIIP